MADNNDFVSSRLRQNLEKQYKAQIASEEDKQTRYLKEQVALQIQLNQLSEKDLDTKEKIKQALANIEERINTSIKDVELLKEAQDNVEEAVRKATKEEEEKAKTLQDQIALWEKRVKLATDEKEATLLGSQAHEDAVAYEEEALKKLAELKEEEREYTLIYEDKLARLQNSRLTKEQQLIKKAADTRKAADKAREEADKKAAENAVKLAKGELTDKDKEELEDLENAAKRAEDVANKATVGANAAKKVADTVKGIIQQFEQDMATYSQYNSKINARLQGTGDSYEKLMLKSTLTLGISPFAQQRKYMENLDKLVGAGIAYNVEQRTFLATISDKIATTFDVFDANLLRLIRLQQADTTAARLGMEASLTSLFNNMFQDTSYLNNMYDTVSGAIIDANSQLTRDESLAFEYQVQKWLGALSSVGFSDNAVNVIAQGLNYLGTGNVSALASNDSLQTLMAMSASRSGVSYSDILTGGLDANKTNKLFESMVYYLKEISDTNNQVVKSQYANLFGMSVSDFRALASLDEETITNIANSSMTYKGATNELNSQMTKIITRMSMAEMLDNIYNNSTFSMASTMASNPITYSLYKISSLVQDLTGGESGGSGGISIPFINAMGFGLDLNDSVAGLLKLGTVGVSTLGLIGGLAGALATGGGLNLSAWGGEEYTSRGSGNIGIKGGAFEGSSGAQYIGNQSGKDQQNTALAKAGEDAQTTTETIGSSANEHKDDRTTEDLYQALLEDEKPIKVKFDETSSMNVVLKQISDQTYSKMQEYFVTQLAAKIFGAMMGNNPSTQVNENNNNKNEDTYTLQDMATAICKWLDNGETKPKVSVEELDNMNKYQLPGASVGLLGIGV